MLKVAIYVRLSREDRYKINSDDDSESIKNQIILLTDKCEKEGWFVYEIYSDDDFSGSDKDRPAFNQMINAAREKKFDIVLCKTQSRFARDIEVVEKYINFLFPLWGIRFISIVDNADTSVKANKKARQIVGLIDQWYLEDISENIRQTLSVKRKQGQYVGAFAPYGYIKDPKDKHHLIVDEEAAKTIRYIYDLYLSGYGVESLALRLNNEKILNPAAYKKSKGIPFQRYKRDDFSRFWTVGTVRTILTNIVYLGHTVQHKFENLSYKSSKRIAVPPEDWDIVYNTHTPIIDETIFNKVQSIRKQRTRSTSLKNSGKRSLFSKKIRCLHCDRAMKYWHSGGRLYYRCNTRFMSKESCVGACVSEKVLSEKVLEEVRKLYQLYVDDDFVANGIDLDNQNGKLSILNKTLTAHTTELKKINARFQQMYIDKLDGLITIDEFNDINQTLRKTKNQLEVSVRDTEYEIQVLKEKFKEKKDLLEFVKQYKDIEVLDRTTIDELIDYVEVGGSKTDRIINIHWNF